MKFINACFFVLAMIVISCTGAESTNQKSVSETKKTTVEKNKPNPQEANKNDTIASFKKYDLESGVITFNTSMVTLTVNISYKTVITFDHYGMREKRDTYDGDVLTETFLSDGFNNYNISHTNKKIVRTGKAYRGTESKFGWDNVSPEDIKAGKVIKEPEMIIADKRCEVYTILAGVATVTYGGWRGIILLNKVESPGGKSKSEAVHVQINSVSEDAFKLPEGYSIKG